MTKIVKDGKWQACMLCFWKGTGHKCTFSLVKGTLREICKFLKEHFKGTEALTRGHGGNCHPCLCESIRHEMMCTLIYPTQFLWVLNINVSMFNSTYSVICNILPLGSLNSTVRPFQYRNNTKTYIHKVQKAHISIKVTSQSMKHQRLFWSCKRTFHSKFWSNKIVRTQPGQDSGCRFCQILFVLSNRPSGFVKANVFWKWIKWEDVGVAGIQTLKITRQMFSESELSERM